MLSCLNRPKFMKQGFFVFTSIFIYSLKFKLRHKPQPVKNPIITRTTVAINQPIYFISLISLIASCTLVITEIIDADPNPNVKNTNATIKITTAIKMTSFLNKFIFTPPPAVLFYFCFDNIHLSISDLLNLYEPLISTTGIFSVLSHLSKVDRLMFK